MSLKEYGKNRQCPSLRLGINGEREAKKILIEKGYKFINANWRYKHLELDLIFQDGETIVFVEVKTRSTFSHGGAAGAITREKQKNLLKAALAWLQTNNLNERPCRFDVICLTGAKNDFLVEHFQNAFDTGLFMDCRYPAW